MADLTAEFAQIRSVLQRRWLGLCWELGAVMAEQSPWLEAFRHGQANAEAHAHPRNPSVTKQRADALYQRSLHEWGIADGRRVPGDRANLVQLRPRHEAQAG